MIKNQGYKLSSTCYTLDFYVVIYNILLFIMF